MAMAVKILESGIKAFANILIKVYIYPYSVNHVIGIAWFGKQESEELIQESRNQASNPGIKPRFPKDSKSRWRTPIVADPSVNVYLVFLNAAYLLLCTFVFFSRFFLIKLQCSVNNTLLNFVVFLSKVNDAFERSKEKKLQHEVLLRKEGHNFYM